MVVAEVLATRPHPKSKKLTLVSISAGAASEEVVCGAPNVPAPGGRVLWARPGARLPDGRVLEAREVAGVRSPGMLCSEVELGLGEDASGIIVLDGELAGASPGQPAEDALGLRDDVLEINVTANRPDCLGHLGVAREVAALFGARLREPAIDLAEPSSEGAAAERVTVVVEDPEGCPRYTARVVDGVAVRPSPFLSATRAAPN